LFENHVISNQLQSVLLNYQLQMVKACDKLKRISKLEAEMILMKEDLLFLKSEYVKMNTQSTLKIKQRKERGKKYKPCEGCQKYGLGKKFRYKEQY